MKNCKKARSRVGITAVFVITGMLILLGTSAVVFRAADHHGISDTSVVATVNGKAIFYGELRLQMDKERASVTQYYYEKYGISDSTHFWNLVIDGETPIEKLKEEALEAAVNIKIQQIIAKEYDLVEYIDYKHFRKDWEAENKKRKTAIENGEVVYGPSEYDEMSYYDYVFSNLVIQLKEVLWDKVYTADDQALEKYYEELKDTYYKQPDTIKIRLYSVDLAKSGNGQTLTDKINELEKIRHDLITTNTISGYVIGTDMTFDLSTYDLDLQYQPELLSKVNEVETGQVSEVFVNNNSVCFFRVIDKASNGYKAFNDVKSYVTQKYIEDQYDSFLEKYKQTAVVQKNEKVYESLGTVNE